MGATADLPRDDLEKRIRELERRLAIQEQKSPFAGTGFSVPAPNQINAAGLLKSPAFDGDLSTGNAGTTGWAVNDTDAAFGNLHLRPGSVSNDALTSPVVGQNARVSASNFALTTSLAELAGINLTVPAGCTQLVATAGAFVFAYNPNTTGGSNGAGGDAIYAQVKLGAQTSHPNPIGVSGSNGFATSSSADAFTFSGLTPGNTLRLSAMGSGAYQAIAANTNNNCNAWVQLIWLR